MGLAASQARFLGLTARKSNVEYKGQQINQARTALSNEVNNLFSKYNSLDVPTPPVKQDYIKTKYVLNSTDSKYAITNYEKITSGDNEGYYNVTIEYTENVAQIYSSYNKQTILTAKKNANNEYTYLNIQLGTDVYTYDSEDEKGSTIQRIVIEEGDTETAKQYQGLEAIMKKNNMTSGVFYKFTRNNMPFYTSDADLNSTEDFVEKDGKYTYYGAYTFDYQGSQSTTKAASAIAAITQNPNGRLSAVQIISSDDTEIQPLIGSPYSINVSQEDNESEYQDAMNQYNYNKAKYEKQVETINKETEVLQKEDRALELQLNQLDTEQKAISTEMDAIQDVIKKTAESIFKTYES